MDKKAKLFTKRIAERLSKERSHKSGKNKAVLLKSIQNVTKESLKKTLQDNIDLYFQYLNKCLKRFEVKHDFKTDGEDIKLVQTWEDCRNLTRLNKEDKRQICVRVLLQQLEHADEELVSLVDQFEETRAERGNDPVPAWMTAANNLLVSTINGAVVSKLMLYYLVKLLPVADECLKSGENVDGILASLKQFLVMAHLRGGNKDDPSVEDGRPKKKDVLASLLSIFIDLFLFVNRDSDKKKVSREMTGVTTYLLGGDWSMRLDVLIQVNTPVSSPSLISFVRSCLERTPATMTEYSTYLKLMICLRKFRDQIKDIVEHNLKIRAPLGFIDWLIDKSPEAMAEIPDDIRFKGRQITYFLINNQSDELQLLLEDVLTDSEAAAYLKPPDLGNNAEQEQEPEPEELFVLDRKGGEKILKKKSKKMSNEEKAMEVDAVEETIEIQDNDDIEVIDLSNVLDAIHSSKAPTEYMGTDYVSNSSQDSPKPTMPIPSFKAPAGKFKKDNKNKDRIPDDTIVLDTETSSDAEETGERLVAPDLLQHLKHQPNRQDICIIDESDDVVEIRSTTKKQAKDEKKPDSKTEIIYLEDEGKNKKKKHSPKSPGPGQPDGGRKMNKSPKAGMIDLTSDDDDDDDVVEVNGYFVSSSEAKAVRGSVMLSTDSLKSPKALRSPSLSQETVIEIDDDCIQVGKASTVSPVTDKEGVEQRSTDSRSPSKADNRLGPKKPIQDGTTAPVSRLRSPRKSSNSTSESDHENKEKNSKSPRNVEDSTEITGSPAKKKFTKLDAAKSPELTGSEKVMMQSPESPSKMKPSSPIKTAVMKMSEYLQTDAAPAAQAPERASRRSGLSVTEMGSLVKETRSIAETEAVKDVSVGRRKRRSSKLDDVDTDVQTPKRGRKASRSSESDVQSPKCGRKVSRSSESDVQSPKRGRKVSSESDEDSVTSSGSLIKEKSRKSQRSTSHSDEGEKKVPGIGGKTLMPTQDKLSRRCSRKSSSSKHSSDDAPNSDIEKESGENANLPSTPDKHMKIAPKSTPTRHSKRQSSASESEDSVFTKPENDGRKSPASPSKDSETPQGKKKKMDTTQTTPKGRRSLSKSTPMVSKSDKKTPTSVTKTPQRTRSSIIDSPMITRSGKKINVPRRRRTATPESSETKKFLPDIQEDDEDVEVSISNSPSKQVGSSTTRRSSRKTSD